MPQFILTRVEDDYEGRPVAALNIYRDGDQIQIEVRSKSKMLRDHLHDVLASPFYQISPMNYLAAGISANYSLYIEPKTKLFIMYLSDRLGWYGYIMRPVNKNSVLKSIHELHYSFFAAVDFLPDRAALVIKAVGAGGGCGGGGEMYYNKKGELVVMRVPAGCMAVSSDGRVVGPGKYLHARVNTPDSSWSLVEIPQEYQKYLETYNKQTELTEKTGNERALDKLIAKNKKRLLEKVKKGEAKYSPILHLLTNRLKKEEIEEPTSELRGKSEEKPPEKIYAEYVQIPEEEYKEFEENIKEIIESAVKLDTSPQEMPGDEEGADVPEFNPALGSAGRLNVAEAVYINPDQGLLATAATMPRMLQLNQDANSGLQKGVWKFAIPNEYSNIQHNDEAIEKEARRLLDAGEKLSPWLAAKYHLLLNKRNGATSAGGKIDFEKFAKTYNVDTDALRELDVSKEFIGRIHSLVGVSPIENSAYEPLEFSREVTSSWEDLRDDPNERKREDEVRTYVQSSLSKVLERSEDGILHFKKDVFEIKDTPKTFKDVAGSSKEYWNEMTFRLNRPDLGNYQAVLADIIAYPKMYAWTGGLKQSKGFDLNLEQGTGKTVIMLAAEAAMRSKPEFADHFKGKVLVNGRWRNVEKFTIITAPNPHNWVNTLKGARKENALYIGGTRAQRQEQWDKLLRDIEAGKRVPRYIVVGTGKFRSDKETMKLSEEEEAEYRVDSMDIRYMKMLTVGFKSKSTGKVVADQGLVANFVLDEAGLFVNNSSNRTKLMREVRALVTSERNKGLFFTLNGEVLSNSMNDVVYRMAYVNDKAFGGEDAIIGRYGEPMPKSPGRFVLAGTRAVHELRKFLEDNKDRLISSEIAVVKKQVQEAAQRLQKTTTEFLNEFPNSFRLNMTMITGKDLKSSSVVTAPLSGTFAKVYRDVFNKFKAIKQLQQNAKDNAQLKEIIQAYGLGAFTTLMQSSFGVANPRTLFEYGIQDDLLWSKIHKALRKKHELDVDFNNEEKLEAYQAEVKKIKDEIDEYLSIATETPFEAFSDNSPLAAFSHVLKRIPKSSKKMTYDEVLGKEKGFTTAYRNKLWERYVSEDTRKFLQDLINSEPDPVSSKILTEAVRLLDEQANADNAKPRLVIGSGSRLLAEKVAARLQEQYKDDDSITVQIITGDTPQDVRAKIEAIHNNSDKKVITIVTNAGARGLNLQAPYMIRTPLWSAGQAVQMDARARRDPAKPLQVRKIVSTGASLYMNNTEEGKTALAKMLDTGADFDDLEKAVEALGNRYDMINLISELETLNAGLVE